MTTSAAARRSARGWAALGVLGELLITAGVLLLLLLAYQLWWTNVVAERAADQAARSLRDSWAAAPRGSGQVPGPVDDNGPGRAGAIALLYVPRLADRVWGLPVMDGVEPADLARGTGHYPQSQSPGELGNFAVAGHRATNGEPLRDVDRLRIGDPIYVETQDAWYEYTLHSDRIVGPRDTWVISAVPGRPGARPDQALLTLTTCHPRWASTQRWVWWAQLDRTWAKDRDPLPPAIEAGR